MPGSDAIDGSKYRFFGTGTCRKCTPEEVSACPIANNLQYLLAPRDIVNVKGTLIIECQKGQKSRLIPIGSIIEERYIEQGLMKRLVVGLVNKTLRLKG